MAASKQDLDWRGARGAATVAYDPNSRYTLHRVANAILAVCQFAAMICHIVCFGVMLNKINEIEDKIGRPASDEVCILYMTAEKTTDGNKEIIVVHYNGGHTCSFVVFASIALAILAAMMLIFLIVRIVLVKK